MEEKQVIIGNKKMLDKYQIEVDNKIPENAILIAVNNKISAYITLNERIREGVKETITKLYETGIKKL